MSILIDKDTTFTRRGIPGREAVNMTRECLNYGAKVVAGVAPGRKGRDVYGVPVFDTVRQITDTMHVDASVVTVPPAFAADAALEAIDAGIKLIVIVTERMPRGETAQVIEFADTHGARVIGPNCLGVISPGKSKVGGVGGPAEDTRKAYMPGPVGIMSRSGGMTTEIASTLTAAGLGQSTGTRLGGHPTIGNTYADFMPLFEADADG